MSKWIEVDGEKYFEETYLELVIRQRDQYKRDQETASANAKKLEQEVARLRAEMEWRPFNTAPRDGTEFTGGWSKSNRYATGTPLCWQNGSRRSGWFALSPTYENDEGKFFPGKWINERDVPTHWRPRPDPPTDQPAAPPESRNDAETLRHD